LGITSNSSIFIKMHGLKKCPTNWALVLGCNSEESTRNLSRDDSKEDWSQHYT
jgi:hypothetical protein